MEIKILYEDEDLLVIDKPSGILVHNDGKNNSRETISNWFLRKYPEAEKVGEPVFISSKENLSADRQIKKPGIVHRLDKETSGVLILVKNQKAHQLIKEQFQNHSIKKIYLAIVEGWLKKDEGTIDKPIGRSPSDFRRRLAGRGARGELREAVTRYKVLKRFSILEQKLSLLEVSPKTGRTHQIRAHLKFLNYPIICDSLYNPKGICPKELGRLALHAQSVEFKNLQDKTIKIEAPTPFALEKFLC